MTSPPETFLHGRRTPFAAAPEAVRTWVLDRTGPLLTEPRDCVGGMATGVAAVVTGERSDVFVKAVDVADNPRGGELYRREAAAAADLPPDRHIPTLLDSGPVRTEGVDWWVNVLQARPGRTPTHPWRRDDLSRALEAWAELQPVLAARPWRGASRLAGFFTGWRQVAADPEDPWWGLARHWVEREERLAASVDGGAQAVLAHADLRADNILLGEEPAEVAFVDWADPQPAAPWVDVAVLLADVAMSGAAVESGGPVDVVETFVGAEPGSDPELAVTLVASLGAVLHRRAWTESLDPAMPHRLTWSAATAAAVLPFVEAHSR